MNKFGFPLSFIAAFAMGVAALSGATPVFSQSAPQEDANSPKVSSQRYGDWMLECVEPAINGMSCQIKQQIVHNESGQSILLMTLTYNPAEKKATWCNTYCRSISCWFRVLA